MNDIEGIADRIIMALVVLATVTIAGVLAAVAFTEDSTTVIAAIIGISSPLILGLLGILINSLTRHINSRMTELMDLTRSAAFAEGQKDTSEDAAHNG